MAIVKGPALSLAASGNLGAICYSRWRGKAIARDVWTGTDPGTAKQLAQRAIMTTISQAWGGSLNADEREAWENSAKMQTVIDRLQDTYIPTGYQWFCELNLHHFAVEVGATIMKTPPLSPITVYVKYCSLSNDPFLDRIRIIMMKSWYVKLDSDGYQVYKAGPYDSGGRHALDGEYRFTKNVITASGAWWDIDVIDTKWYWYRMRWFFDTGFVGNWWELQIKIDFP